MGGGTRGGSSGRAKFAAACLASDFAPFSSKVEFLNEKADRWADEGREDVDNVRWDGPSSHPTFSWTDAGVEQRCSMNKTLRARVQGGRAATSSS